MKSKLLGMMDYEKAYQKIWEHFNKITPFTRNEFEMVTQHAQVTTLKKGVIIYKQGSIPTYGGFVIKGSLRYFYTPKLERREITTGFQFEDTCFGDLRSIFYNEPAMNALQTMEETIIGRLDKIHYLQLFDTCKPFAKVMMLSLEQRYNELMGETIERIDREAEQRYLKMVESYPQILQRASQRHIASYLGIQPQSLSRIRKSIMVRPTAQA